MKKNVMKLNLIHFMQKNSVHDPTIVITPFVAVDDWTGEVNRQRIETVQRGVGVPEDERRTGTRPHVSAHSREYRVATCWRNQKKYFNGISELNQMRAEPAVTSVR